MPPQKPHPETFESVIPLGQPQHFAWLRGILLATLILNVFDAGMTIYWILSGSATEANPMMETLMAYGPFPLMAGKLLLVSLGSYVLWRFRRRPLAVVFIFGGFLTYYGISLIHLRAMNLRLLERLFD